MTDEELIAQLRGSCFLAFDDGTNEYASAPAAADRIEALVKERDRYRDAFNTNCLVLRGTEERTARLEAALRETTQVLRQCTFPYIRVKGQYLDREEVVSRADAALKGADHD